MSTITYQRQTPDVVGVVRVEALTEAEVIDLRFIDKMNFMEKSALDEISEMVGKARKGANPAPAENPLAGLGGGYQGRFNPGLAALQQNLYGNPHVNGQAAQQIPGQYLGMLGLRGF